MGFRELLGWWTSIGAPSHIPCPIYPFHCCYWVVSFKLTNNISVSLSFVSCYSKLLDLRSSLCQPQIYSQEVSSTDNHLGFATDIWSGGILGGLNPLSCGIWHKLQVDSARIKLDHGTVGWYLQRTARSQCVKNP